LLNNNKNTEHPLINSQTMDLKRLSSNIEECEEWNLNSLLLTPFPFNSIQQTNIPINFEKDVSEDSTTSTTSIISSTVLINISIFILTAFLFYVYSNHTYLFISTLLFFRKIFLIVLNKG
jgi:hypothetical protein